MKQITLTKGQFAIVDDEDYEWLSQWKWHVAHGYAVPLYHGEFGQLNSGARA
jgi:hypothetical protein